MTEKLSLKVLIVGAGIGGLTAACALRRQGHQVTLFESSHFSHEVGAAVHVGPNAHGILKTLGLDLYEAGAVTHNAMKVCNAKTGKVRMFHSVEESNKQWQNEWVMLHRVALHKLLRERALDEDTSLGPVPVLRLASRVASIDPLESSLTLVDGEVASGDVIIGADGVHSNCRKALRNGSAYIPFDSGRSAYRFTIPVERLQKDPEASKVLEPLDGLSLFSGPDHSMVLYPCNNATLMNSAFIFPSSHLDHTNDSASGWNTGASKESLLKECEGLCPLIKSVVKHVDDELKVWTLLDMAVLPEWTHHNLAVLGDAAHPFLPYQGQGAAQAIEDAASIATMLSPRELTKDAIPGRLKLYQKARMDRANYIQEGTRQMGYPEELRKKLGDTRTNLDVAVFNFNHDEFHHSQDILDRHLQSKRAYRWRAPVCSAFGPAPGPRQVTAHTATSRAGPQMQSVATIRFKTSKTYVSRLFPQNGKFSFQSPATVATAQWQCSTYRNVQWLAGRSYTTVGLYLEGVQYRKENGDLVTGSFCPVMFCNSADAIQAEGSDLGIPMVYCNTEVAKPDGEGARDVKLSWDGTSFAEFSINGLQASDKDDFTPNGPSHEGLLFHRYIPAVNEPQKADAEYAVFVPPRTHRAANGQVNGQVNGDVSKSTKSSLSTSHSANISIKAGTCETLPTLHHITRYLSEMPVREVLEAMIEERSDADDMSDAGKLF